MDHPDETGRDAARVGEPPRTPRQFSRRDWLRLGAFGAGAMEFAAGLKGLAAGPAEEPSAERSLIVRSRRPLNLESPVAALDHRLTPNDAFFVRSHFGAPAVDLAPWEVEVVGLVKTPLRLTLDTMACLEMVTKAAVLQCAGNGRGLYRPRVPGVPWERGAVGQAEWSGVRLADLLDRAGVVGGDAPPSPKTPAFVRSIPIDRARDPSTILALGMNGAPLPAIHGGPVRLVVPGWAGNNWTKWIRRIVVARDEAPGFYMQTGYRMSRTPAAPGAPAAAAPADPVTWMNVKSLVTWPERGGKIAAGPVELRGIAWTGQGHVTKVEVRIGDDDRWLSATLSGDPEPGAWRPWRLRWEPARRGRHVIAARATDSMGQVQPESPPWNKSGYLWNGWDTVAFDVG
jgi:DMSO/TMAO reductase YedYZ molybdopterin-dependent catalytic subunit